MSPTTVVLITGKGLGTTAPEDAAFGERMLESFLHTLEGHRPLPTAVCLYTEGVFAACEGHPALLSLQFLAGLDVRVVSCGTCLDQYGMREKLGAGEVGTMAGIVAMLTAADRVIRV